MKKYPPNPVFVKIQQNGDVIAVYSPYNDDWIREAQTLGGEWSKAQKAWLFYADHNIVPQIKAKLLDIYGDDGQQNAYYTVIAEYDGILTEQCQVFYSAKRPLLKRKSFDKPVECAKDVLLVEGHFPPTGGTAKAPKIGQALSKTFVCQIRHVSQYILDHWHEYSSGRILSSYKEHQSVSQQENDLATLNQIQSLIPKLSNPIIKITLQSLISALIDHLDSETDQ